MPKFSPRPVPIQVCSECGLDWGEHEQRGLSARREVLYRSVDEDDLDDMVEEAGPLMSPVICIQLLKEANRGPQGYPGPPGATGMMGAPGPAGPRGRDGKDAGWGVNFITGNEGAPS